MLAHLEKVLAHHQKVLAHHRRSGGAPAKVLAPEIKKRGASTFPVRHHFLKGAPSCPRKNRHPWDTSTFPYGSITFHQNQLTQTDHLHFKAHTKIQHLKVRRTLPTPAVASPRPARSRPGRTRDPRKGVVPYARAPVTAGFITEVVK